MHQCPRSVLQRFAFQQNAELWRKFTILLFDEVTICILGWVHLVLLKYCEQDKCCDCKIHIAALLMLLCSLFVVPHVNIALKHTFITDVILSNVAPF